MRPHLAGHIASSPSSAATGLQTCRQMWCGVNGTTALCVLVALVMVGRRTGARAA